MTYSILRPKQTKPVTNLNLNNLKFISDPLFRKGRDNRMPEPWIQIQMLKPMVNLLLKILVLTALKHEFMKFVSEIEELYLKSKPKFTVMYMKEAQIIIFKYLAGDTYTINYDCVVRRDKAHGLPAFIPLILRRHIVERDERVTRAVITVLNCYRGIQLENTTVDTQPIIAPFKGTDDTLPSIQIKNSLKELGIKRITFSDAPRLKPF